MRKIASFVILLVVIIVLLGMYVIIQTRQMPQWQIKLDNYVKYRNEILRNDPLVSGTATVERVIQASHPENFHEIGDKRIIVHNHYWLEENREKLSYPPEQVMIALLREEIRSTDDIEPETSYRVLFVVLYSYNVEPEWLIYETDDVSKYLKSFEKDAAEF